MPELVGERLDLGGVVHVHPHRHLAGHVVGQPVGTADRLGVGDQPQLEAVRCDLIGQAVPQPFGCLALQEGRGRWLGDGFAVGLGDVPDVRGLEADELGSHGLAEAGLLAPAPVVATSLGQ